MITGAVFSGTGVAMVTPFSEDGSVNYSQLEKNVDHLIAQGVNYLVVLGTTAESPTLTKKEKLEIIRVSIETIGGRVPVVVGAGGNCTADVIDWIREVGSEGIDAYLSVAPYYNKPSQEGMKAHFSAIAAISDIPLMLYNVPGRTGSNISADTTLELSHELGEKIVATKEASGDFAQIMAILKDKPGHFEVVSGDDAIALPMISLGAKGIVSVLGNALPALFSSMIQEALAGDFESARAKHFDVLPMIELIFREGNPAGVKALMEILGLGKSNLRLPLIPASAALQKDIETALGNIQKN